MGSHPVLLGPGCRTMEISRISPAGKASDFEKNETLEPVDNRFSMQGESRGLATRQRVSRRQPFPWSGRAVLLLRGRFCLLASIRLHRSADSVDLPLVLPYVVCRRVRTISEMDGRENWLPGLRTSLVPTDPDACRLRSKVARQLAAPRCLRT